MVLCKSSQAIGLQNYSQLALKAGREETGRKLWVDLTLQLRKAWGWKRALRVISAAKK